MFIDHEFDANRDQYGWTLRRYRFKTGKLLVRKSYYGNLVDLFNAILDIKAGETDSIFNLGERLTEAIVLLSDSLQAAVDDISVRG